MKQNECRLPFHPSIHSVFQSTNNSEVGQQLVYLQLVSCLYLSNKTPMFPCLHLTELKELSQPLSLRRSFSSQSKTGFCSELLILAARTHCSLASVIHLWGSDPPGGFFWTLTLSKACAISQGLASCTGRDLLQLFKPMWLYFSPVINSLGVGSCQCWFSVSTVLRKVPCDFFFLLRDCCCPDCQALFLSHKQERKSDNGAFPEAPPSPFSLQLIGYLFLQGKLGSVVFQLGTMSRLFY